MKNSNMTIVVSEGTFSGRTSHPVLVKLIKLQEKMRENKSEINYCRFLKHLVHIIQSFILWITRDCFHNFLIFYFTSSTFCLFNHPQVPHGSDQEGLELGPHQHSHSTGLR